jgi:hypothetical protein
MVPAAGGPELKGSRYRDMRRPEGPPKWHEVHIVILVALH